jgi:ABC-2 type transport system permease protein
MMTYLTVLQNDLKRLWSEKGLILILLLMPLGFILPVGMAYSGSQAGTGDKDQPLLVIDYDGGKQAADLIKKLDENFLIERNLAGEPVEKYNLAADPDCAAPGPACDEKIGRAQLKDSTRSVALLIPASLSTAFGQSQKSVVQLLYDPSGDVNFVDQVQGVVKGATIAISLEKQVMQGKQDMRDLSAIGSDAVKEAVQKAADKPVIEKDPAIQYEKIAPTNYLERKAPNALQQTIPGYTVMFAFMVAGFMAGWGSEEKRNGILRRLRSTPVGASGLLGGKLLYGMVVSMAQILILFLVGVLFFHFSLGKDLLAFILITFALSAAVSSLGILAIAIRFPSSALTAPLVIFALLGGCLFTTDLLPPALRFLSNFIPHSWAMSGYQDLLVRGQGLLQVLPEIGVLVSFAVLFLGIAVWKFDPLD